jgi:SRSO17 transposase
VTQVINEAAASVSLEGIAAGVRAVDTVIKARLADVFAQRRSMEVAFDYLDALSPRARGNCWALAEAAGHHGWWRMQALLNQYVWDFTAVRAALGPLAARWLTCPDDDLVGPGIAVDETAVLKKGDHTFAVAPQHAGCTGKVENCVTTVFSAYVTTTGSCWADFDVYMPRRWADDPARRTRAGVPRDLKFATKPELADAQIRRLVATGIGIDWIAGDEVYGRSTRLRATCTELNLTSVFIVPVNFQITTPAGTTMTAAQAAALADAQDAFERRPCGNGSKGPRLFDWALVATTDPHEFLLIRRLISRPDQLTFLICHVPDLTRARLPYLATIAGRRWPVEETFKVGKDVLDFDQSQVRTYTAINRHTVLTALAQLRQATARARLTNPTTNPTSGPTTPPPAAPLSPLDLPDLATIPLGDSPVPTHPDQPRPADLGHIKLSVAEHHRLLQLARAKAAGLLSRAAEIFHLHWSSLRRRHQATARWHHYRRLHQALDPG